MIRDKWVKKSSGGNQANGTNRVGAKMEDFFFLAHTGPALCSDPRGLRFSLSRLLCMTFSEGLLSLGALYILSTALSGSLRSHSAQWDPLQSLALGAI